METLESLKWLKDHNLYELASKVALSLKGVFTPCLAVKDEKVLISAAFESLRVLNMERNMELMDNLESDWRQVFDLKVDED